MPVSSRMIPIASKLGASAVANIELVIAVDANAVHIKYAPIRRAVGPGAEP